VVSREAGVAQATQQGLWQGLWDPVRQGRVGSGTVGTREHTGTERLGTAGLRGIVISTRVITFDNTKTAEFRIPKAPPVEHSPSTPRLTAGCVLLVAAVSHCPRSCRAYFRARNLWLALLVSREPG